VRNFLRDAAQIQTARQTVRQICLIAWPPLW